MQEEKFHVAFEAFEQSEEIGIPGKRLTEGAAHAEVVPSYTFEGEIEPIGDLLIEPAGTVDGLFTVHLIAGEKHHPADRVPDIVERLPFHFRYLVDNVRHPEPAGERGYDGITRKVELAQGRLVVQIRVRRVVVQVEQNAVGQGFAPELHVIFAKCSTVRVRIFSASVGPHVKRRIDS